MVLTYRASAKEPKNNTAQKSLGSDVTNIPEQNKNLFSFDIQNHTTNSLKSPVKTSYRKTD
jgi:hypothetical protein